MNRSIFAAIVVLLLAAFVVQPLYGETGSIAVLSWEAAQLTPTAASTADVGVPSPQLLAAAPPPLSLSLSCSYSCIGDKTGYECTATGSGGCFNGNLYFFSWSGATPTSGGRDNPNYAFRVLTPGGPCQAVVKVTLEDECTFISSSKTIYDYCDSSCGPLP